MGDLDDVVAAVLCDQARLAHEEDGMFMCVSRGGGGVLLKNSIKRAVGYH